MMKCPICNNIMEEGFIQAVQRVAWVKKKHKLSLRPREGEVLLENNGFSDALIPAQICKICEKIIVDYSSIDYKVGK